MQKNVDNAKPFIKWAGGKTGLLKEIRKYYPFLKQNITKYAEPFVGGGSVLFDVLNNYHLESVYISDINKELIDAYKVLQKNVYEVIEYLKLYQIEYIDISENERKEYFLQKRDEFNGLKKLTDNTNKIQKAAIMIFLNKTCFNGLYRVNKKGFFNVPIGSYKNPLICDKENLLKVSKKLQKVEIYQKNYTESENFIDENTFVYLDPPYRPITKTSNFTSYTENGFGDNEQIELANFVATISEAGAKVLLSNSDPKSVDENDDFFDKLYKNYYIKRVEASRMINSKRTKRGKINEILVSNFILYD